MSLDGFLAEHETVELNSIPIGTNIVSWVAAGSFSISLKTDTMPAEIGAALALYFVEHIPRCGCADPSQWGRLATRIAPNISTPFGAVVCVIGLLPY